MERCTKVLLKYYWKFTVEAKRSLIAHPRMVLSSIAVSYRLALGGSVLQGAPRLVLLSGQVLSTRDAWATTEKKITVQRLCFICFDEGIENLSWAACSFTSISHQPQGKILRVKFSKINFCDISHQENPCRIFQLFQHHPIIQTESSWMLIKPVSPSEFIQDTSVPEERVWQQMTERKILKWHPLQNLLNSGWLSSHSSFPFISSLPTVSLSG